MGYYHNIVLAVAPEATDTFYALLSSDEELFQMVRIGSDNFDTSQFRKGDVLVEWYDVKWGISYPEVAKLHKWIEGQNEGYYRFLRIGEDRDDIEEHGDYAWDYISMTRPQIEIDKPLEVKD